MDDVMLRGGAQPRAPVARVVRVRARGGGGEAAGGGEGAEAVVELALAVVAAELVVADVAFARELGGRDRLVPDADRAGDVAGAVELSRRERRRDGGQSQRPLAERPRRERRDERGV